MWGSSCNWVITHITEWFIEGLESVGKDVTILRGMIQMLWTPSAARIRKTMSQWGISGSTWDREAVCSVPSVRASISLNCVIRMKGQLIISWLLLVHSWPTVPDSEREREKKEHISRGISSFHHKSHSYPGQIVLTSTRTYHSALTKEALHSDQNEVRRNTKFLI